jgi:hypothetical protein
MAIRTGIGVGAAQIADTSNIMNAYGRQIAQQQKAQALKAEKEAKAAEKYNEELADLMASVKTTGARDIDIPDITNAYNEIKEYYAQSAKLKDSDKPLFRAELRNRINTLNDTAIRSGQLSKDVGAVLNDIAENEWDYDPMAVKEIREINQTPLLKLGARSVIDPMRYKKLPNFGLIDTIIDKTYDLGKKNAKFVGEVFDKGKRFNVKRVDPVAIQNNLIQQFTSSPEAMKAISNLYSRELGKQPTDQDLTNYIMDKYKTKYDFDYVGEARDIKKARGGSGAESDKLSYRQQIIGGVLQLDPASISKMQAQLPSGSKVEPLSSKEIEGISKGGYPTYKVRVTIPGNDKNDPISEVIDLKTGEPAIRFNQLLNEYSGETVSYSKFGIEGAKPRGEQFEPEKPKPNKGSKMSPEDTDALNWANANPRDPRAKAIKDKLKADKKI